MKLLAILGSLDCGWERETSFGLGEVSQLSVAYFKDNLAREVRKWKGEDAQTLSCKDLTWVSPSVWPLAGF